MSKLNKILSQTLNLAEEKLTDELGMGSVENWDSLGHIQIISQLEEEFAIEFRAEHIENMRNIGNIKKVLQEAGIKDF